MTSDKRPEDSGYIARPASAQFSEQNSPAPSHGQDQYDHRPNFDNNGGQGHFSAPDQQQFAGQNPSYGQQDFNGQYGQQNQLAGQGQYPRQGQYGQPQQQTQPRNTMAIVAFAVAVIGFIFACIPGALIVGWILLPIAFLLSIISFFMKGKKGFGIAALIISVVGTIVGLFVFFALAANAVDDALGGDSSVERPEGSAGATDSGANSDLGSRENPLPIGTKITQGDWAVTINSVNLNATDQVMAENSFNDAPEPGMQYMLVNLTAEYIGNDPQGSSPLTTINYVKSDGTTIDSYSSDSIAVAPDSFDLTEKVYEGGSVSGNTAIAVPSDTAADGVLAVSVSMLGDDAFVAVK